MHIRPASKSDLEAITLVQARTTMVAAAQYQDSVDEELEYRCLHPRLSGYLAGIHSPQHALPERSVFVAEHDGQIIGFIAGHRSTRRGCNAELQWMFVLPKWQRQGVGGHLLQALTQWFIEQQATRVIVDAPTRQPLPRLLPEARRNRIGRPLALLEGHKQCAGIRAASTPEQDHWLKLQFSTRCFRRMQQL